MDGSEDDPDSQTREQVKNRQRPSCAECSAAKKKCVWPEPKQDEDDVLVCLRCQENRRTCTEQDMSISRRRKEKLARKRGGGARGRPRTREAGSAPTTRANVAETEKPSQTESAAKTTVAVTQVHFFPTEVTLGASAGASTDHESLNTANGPRYAGFFLPPVPAPAPAPRPAVGPTTSGLVDVEILLPCVSAFWSYSYFYTPIVHRPSFEDAFANPGPSPIFGQRKPLALLYAMAAIGLRYVPSSALSVSESEKAHLGDVLSSRAKAMLLSDYFAGATGGNRTITAIEALSTLKFLVNETLSEGKADESAVLVERGCTILAELLPLTRVDPKDPVEWLNRELVLRNAIEFTAFDFSRAVLSSTDPQLASMVAGPLPLPVHETLFAMPAAEAFALLYIHKQSTDMPAKMDWSALKEWPMNSEKVQRVVEETTAPMFDGRASVFCCWHVHSAIMFVRARLKVFAKNKGLDVLAIAGQDTELDDANEAEYRRGAAIAHDMVRAFYNTMPAEIGAGLGQGNPAPLFMFGANYTGRGEYFFSVLGACMAMESGRLETWIWTPPHESLDERYFGSPPFLAAMESLIVVAQFADAQLQVDRKLRISHYAPLGSSVRFIGFSFAVLKLMKQNQATRPGNEAIRGLERDIDCLVRYAKTLTAIYTTVGKMLDPWLDKSLQEAELSDEAKMATELIELSRATSNIEFNGTRENENASKTGLTTAFAAGVLNAEEFIRSWIMPGTRAASSVPAVTPVPQPNETRTVDGEMLKTFVEGFFDYASYYSPIVHRPSFDRAFATSEPTVYGPQAPVALMYIIAAIGLRHVPLPAGWSEQDRGQVGTMLYERAHKLLVSDLEAGTNTSKQMTPVGTLSTIKFLLSYSLAEGWAEKAIDFMDRACTMVKDLCFPSQSIAVYFEEDSDCAATWLEKDILLRILVELAAIDYARSLRLGVEPGLWEVLLARLPLPVHDDIFNLPAEDAFRLLLKDGLENRRVRVDWSPLAEWPLDRAKMCALVKEMTAPLFDRRTFAFGAFSVQNVFILARHNLRTFARAHGLDVLAIAAHEAVDDSAEEAECRRAAGIINEMVSTFYGTMPAEFGTALSEGNADPFFELGVKYPGDSSRLFPVLSVCMLMEVGRLETWVWAPPGSPVDPRFFGSPPFLAALESSIVVARLMEAQMRVDKQLRVSHFINTGPPVSFGVFTMAAIKLMKARSGQDEHVIKELERDLESFVRYLNVVAAIYTVAGGNSRRALRKAMQESGLVDDGTVGEGLMRNASNGHLGQTSAFALTVLSGDESFKTWWTRGVPNGSSV